MRLYWIILSLILLISAVAAKTETVDLGPFIAEFSADNFSGNVSTEIEPPIQMDDFNIYGFRIFNAEMPIDVSILDYGIPVDVSDSRLTDDIETGWKNLSEFEKIKWRFPASVGGRPAVMAEVIFRDSGHVYDVEYSPDGIGNRGSVIVEIASTTESESTFVKFLNKLKIKRA